MTVDDVIAELVSNESALNKIGISIIREDGSIKSIIEVLEEINIKGVKTYEN